MPSVRCPVCAGPAPDAPVRCRACEVPHHRDCWRWNRGCAVYACQTRWGLGPARGDDQEARARLGAALLTAALLGALVLRDAMILYL